MKRRLNPWQSARHRLAQLFFGPALEEAARLAAVSVRVDDSRGWDGHTPGPTDRSWSERYQDMDDALEAWQKNFMARHIVTLTRAYVVGAGIAVSSRKPRTDAFVQRFWHHPKNHMPSRLGPICDELTRSGEIFPVLFTNALDGMSYVRFVPASQIRQVHTDPDDYETETAYTQNTTSGEPRVWAGIANPAAFTATDEGRLPPLMLHYAVNRPIGATRGEGDLTPILPWARRYSEWLKDRVRLNRQRTRQGLLDIEIADDQMVREKRQQLRTANPIEAGIYVHGAGEVVKMHNLEIKAEEAEADGKVLRLAIAAGANVALHYMGEGESVNYATAKEMGEPTARFYAERQQHLTSFLLDLVAVARWRFLAQTRGAAPGLAEDLDLVANAPETARADNESLSTAARNIVTALAEMRAQGWITDAGAIALAHKFAGEPLTEEEIAAILEDGTQSGPRSQPAGEASEALRPARPAARAREGAAE